MWGKTNITGSSVVGMASVWCFLMLLALQIMTGSKVIVVEGALVNSSNIGGMITVMQIIFLTVILLTFKRGFFVVTILFVVNIVQTVMGYLVTKESSVIIGIFMQVSGYLLLLIVSQYKSKIAKKEKQLVQLANEDALTGLPNRRVLHKKLEQYTKWVRESGGDNDRFALVFVDLDNFKRINDTAGHDCGDKALTLIADLWRAELRGNERLFRIGGDEFAFIIKKYESETELVHRIGEYRNVLDKNLRLKGFEYHVVASYGIALCPENGLEIHHLMKYADTAMYQAKKKKSTGICVFDRKMNEMLETDIKVEECVRHALQSDGFGFVFQPQYEMKTRKLRGFETLLRLQDGNGTLIPPTKFIDVAERNGLINQLDNMVLRKAMRNFYPYVKKNSELLVSVNISASHLVSESFVEEVREAIKEIGFPPQNLEIEITESVFLASLTLAQQHLLEIKCMGIQVALDDFGTGYASLSYLNKLPIDLLKVDKLFIDEIEKSDKHRDFVAAIISMGHTLHLSVLTEGVEYEGQKEILEDLGCDSIQGFLWGKPMGMEEVDKLLEDHSVSKCEMCVNR